MIDVSIIIPFLNEEGNIPNLITALNKYFLKNTDIVVEVILVDDGSTDNSITTLKQQKIEGYSLNLISLSKNFGSHAAVRAGTLNANGNYTIFLPADLQDPLSLVHTCFYLTKEQKAEIVFAYRKETSNGIFETLFSKFYAYCMRKFVAPNFPNKGFDVVFFSKKIKEELNKNIESNSSIQLQILNLGFTSKEIYYTKQERKVGKSKWTISKKIKLMIDSFVAFSYAPIRFVSFVGVLFFMIGILWTIYIVSRKLIYNDVASGWPALTSILLLGFGITNIGLGIIAEYLWRTLDASRKRPVFIIDKIIDIKNDN
jgi:glycosyltransferase involved in cell wall biosynthesis